MAETRGIFGDLFGKKDKDKPAAATKPTAAETAALKNKREREDAAKKAKAALDAKKAADAAAKAALPNIKVDGVWGAETTAAIQKVLGTKVGGAWINNTDAKALQKKLGVTADGVFGVNSVKALQKALNAGTFFPAKKPKAAPAPAAKKGL